jgi:hypothetical protein
MKIVNTSDIIELLDMNKQQTNKNIIKYENQKSDAIFNFFTKLSKI